MNFLNPDSKLMVTLGKGADFLIIGCLWFICSLPIVTIGASTTAFSYAAFKILSEESYITKAFFKSFMQNFKQSTLLWIVALVFLYLGVTGVIFYYNLESSLRVTGLGIMILIMVLYVFTMLYLFPYVSKFYCTFKQAIKNSLLLSIKHLLSTLLMIFLDVAMVFLAFYFTAMLMFLPAIIGLLNSIVLKRVFDKYISQDDAANADDESFMTIEEIEAMDAAMAAEKAKMLEHMESASEEAEETSES